MSTVQKVNFEPATDVMSILRRDFPLVDPTLADPLNAVSLVDGEWLTITSAYKIERACSTITEVYTDNQLATTVATKLSFPLFAERGRTDTRAQSAVKMPVLFAGHYEFDTRIFDASLVAGANGAAITAVLQPLKVATIKLGTRYYCGLVGHGGSSDAHPVVGYVTRLPATNGGKLRFISGWRS